MSELENKNGLIGSLLLEAKNLSHKFDYELFKNINLSLQKQESIAIIGTSGSGKSTLLNILSSLLKPTSGNVVFQRKDIYSLSQNDLLKIRRDDFGIIFQAHYLFRGFSANENLEIAEFLSGEKIDKNLLKELNIEHVINQGVGELSGGQQQRLSIARVLTKKPKIIFADEPTGNLDKDTANVVMNTLFNYIKKNNAGLILVTHENELALRCDKVYKLDNLELKDMR
ncbi:ABC transporter ATP-binding protein [Aliarcobacter butzleri]|jgi:putative ABC transport system ATP-binding protein|uniref:ABC transporter, ATP-binding protein n=2 Tax=Aliarcobacter butzleri TaxID=28197 RepID=A8ES85_ALIB4|nr:ABC transporter ATP-binding protein [Aliarcobacter butzleri]ABV66809.1 ABC transporter, ATP-binding protein [Aliarcobacter butzleri RM4018]EFU70431.1 ABC superfamily ATP binding cassette transporter ABC protein [Aliarcobacter butzleri JV22]KLE03718.1 ABC transporter ATP-binding protein [Aliarcobacter butzleri L353]KLE09660.1 ABC transporter ATP-binding protein [Aliarcobacter butzleri L354]MBF7064601.1 ABC transporter ATP-binding protein [Aliarcobacter butzleri]